MGAEPIHRAIEHLPRLCLRGWEGHSGGTLELIALLDDYGELG